MGRTFQRQDAQMRQSVTFDDTLAAGATLESSSVSIEGDLNSVRSQIRRILDATPAGNWHDDIPTVNTKKRGLLQLNTDLDDVELKKILCRSSILTDITVPASQNWKILSVAGSEAPTRPAAVLATTEGAVVAQSALSAGAFDVHELIEVAGSDATFPKNLMEVRDASTGQRIQSAGRDVFALLQYESTGSDGGTINDTSGGNRVKLSFVRLTAGLDDLEACPVADIENKVLNYAYVDRRIFDTIPEQCFLNNGSFIDHAAVVDVTLDNAIDNQAGPATQTDRDIEWRITDTFELTFQDSTGATNLFRLAPTAGGDTAQFNVDTFDVNNSLDADFLNGATFDSGGTPVRVGVTAGYIDTASADLGIRSGLELYLDDANQAGSTWVQTAGIKLSDTSTEWDNFKTAFGEVSLIEAIYQANNAVSRSKTVAVVTTNITANTDVGGTGGGANLDAQLGDYSTKSFVTDVDVYVNGVLQRNGADAAANHDVYPGTSPALGQLKFEYNLHGGPGNPDVITMIIW